jgi:NADPH:quinone reductase-like Zn-dependent oxidoreductase
MQVAGIRRVGARVEMIESREPRPLARDEVLLEVKAAGVGNGDEFVRTGGWTWVPSRPWRWAWRRPAAVAVGQAVGDWFHAAPTSQQFRR